MPPGAWHPEPVAKARTLYGLIADPYGLLRPEAIARIGDLLAEHFPPTGHNPDELENRPVII